MTGFTRLVMIYMFNLKFHSPCSAGIGEIGPAGIATVAAPARQHGAAPAILRINFHPDRIRRKVIAAHVSIGLFHRARVYLKLETIAVRVAVIKRECEAMVDSPVRSDSDFFQPLISGEQVSQTGVSVGHVIYALFATCLRAAIRVQSFVENGACCKRCGQIWRVGAFLAFLFWYLTELKRFARRVVLHF